MHHGFRFLLGLCLLPSLAACGEGSSGSRGATGDAGEPPPAGPSCANDAPVVTGFAHPTTSPDITLGNLDATIESLTARVERSPSDATAREGLVGALLARVQFTGRFSDFTLAEGAATLPGALADSPAGLVLRSEVAGATHDFATRLASPRALAEKNEKNKSARRASGALRLRCGARWGASPRLAPQSGQPPALRTAMPRRNGPLGCRKRRARP